MADIVIYTATPCGYCQAAKMFFQQKGLAYEEVDLTGKSEERMALVQRTGSRTVPQIWIGETHVGGYTELRELGQSGGLDDLLAS